MIVKFTVPDQNYMYCMQGQIQNFQRGGGGHHEHRRSKFSRVVRGHAPPEIFEHLIL